MSAQLILMGVVGRAHGVRGLVRVHSYADDPAALAAYGPLQDDQGRHWQLRWRGDGLAELRDAAGQPLADRTAAERLTNTRLYVERSRLPEPEAEEFYLADLMGAAAWDEAGQALGQVIQVHDYGAGASLEIGGDGRAPMLVPFTRACVPAVDIVARRITVVKPHEVEARDAAAGAAE